MPSVGRHRTHGLARSRRLSRERLCDYIEAAAVRDLHHHGSDDDRTPDEGRNRRRLADGDPHPKRGEDDLEQGDQGNLRRRGGRVTTYLVSRRSAQIPHGHWVYECWSTVGQPRHGDSKAGRRAHRRIITDPRGHSSLWL